MRSAVLNGVPPRGRARRVGGQTPPSVSGLWGDVMTRLVTTAAVVLVFAGLVGLARAEEKANPTGTWKWSVEAGGQTREFTLKLKLDGDKLTGAMIGRNNQETKIDDGGTFKDGEVSFSVTRERGGQKIVTKYKAKVTGDTLKGKSSIDRNGQVRERDFEAKRAKE